MALYLSPIANDQQMDANGDPLVGGKIYTYLAGSTTPVSTYTDSTGVTAQANPIILNSLGLSASPIWLNGGVSYKFVIKDSADVTLRTIDGISGINDVSSTAQEWNESGLVPTYISATQFSVPGEQTAILQVNRRIRCDVTAGFAYGRISISAFAAGITTITMVNDSTPLDSGLSSVAYGFLSFSPSSVPYALYASAGTNIDITSLGNNTSTVYTTAGTSTAYTITPTPAITAYAIGQSYMVNFNSASGASPTLQISGIATPPNLVKENPDGTYSNIAANDIPSNHRSRVTLISTTQALVERLGATVTAGGVAPVFGARAWCVFNGTTLGTNAPLAGGNVSTVQRTATGAYLITMQTALADTNFSITGSANTGGGNKAVISEGATARSTTTFEVVVSVSGGASSQIDQSLVSVAVFR